MVKNQHQKLLNAVIQMNYLSLFKNFQLYLNWNIPLLSACMNIFQKIYGLKKNKDINQEQPWNQRNAIQKKVNYFIQNGRNMIKKIYEFDVYILNKIISQLIILNVIFNSDQYIFTDIHFRKMNNKRFYYTQQEMNQLIISMIEVLASLQKQNIAHRDIKADNILLNNGKFKLSDFGLSMNCTQNIVNHYAGTQQYVSPLMRNWADKYEKNPNARNLQELVHDVYKSDVFSLGVTMLFASTLEEDLELNQIKFGKTNLQIKFEKLKQLKLYDTFLIDLIQRMCTWEEKDRPNFLDLYEIINGSEFKQQKYEPAFNLMDESTQFNLFVNKTEEFNNIKTEKIARLNNYQSKSLDQIISLSKQQQIIHKFHKQINQNLDIMKLKIQRSREIITGFKIQGSISCNNGQFLATSTDGNIIIFDKFLNMQNHVQVIKEAITCLIDVSIKLRKPRNFIICSSQKQLSLIEFQNQDNAQIYDTVYIKNLFPEEATLGILYYIDELKLLAVSASNKVIKLFNFNKILNNKIKSEYNLIGHNSNITSMTYFQSKNKDFFVSGSSDHSILIWNLNTESIVKIHLIHESWISYLKNIQIQDQNYLVSASGDGHIKIWTYEMGVLIEQTKTVKQNYIIGLNYIEQYQSIFSFDGKNSVSIWDFERDRVKFVNGADTYQSDINSVSFINQQIITTSLNGYIRQYEIVNKN